MMRALMKSFLFLVLTLASASTLVAQRPAAKPRPNDEGQDAPVRKPAAPRAPAPAVSVPASARYRVTLVGFRVNRETYDTFLETDGKGDEIRLAAEVQEFGPNGEPVAATREVKSVVYGDRNTFPSRIAAGSRSAQGGLKTGDVVPAGGEPWVRRGAPQGDRLPMLLWEGELRTNQNMVAISPTVWELDSDDLLNAPANAVIGLGDLVKSVGPIASMIPGVGGLSRALMNVTKPAAAFATNVKERGNRPVGLASAAGKLSFTPSVVGLTTTTAELVIAGQGGARSPGVIEVRYADSEDLKGDYSLFLQVERLP